MNEKVAHGLSWRTDPIITTTDPPSSPSDALAGHDRSLAAHALTPGLRSITRTTWGLQLLKRRIQGLFRTRGSVPQDGQSPLASVFEDFVEALSLTVDPSVVATALVQAAKRLSKATRVDFVYSSFDEPETETPRRGKGARAIPRFVDHPTTMTMPLNYAGQRWGVLKLEGVPPHPQGLGEIGDLDRCLTTLGTVAAMAFDSISTSQLFNSLDTEPLEDTTFVDPLLAHGQSSDFLRDATFIQVILPYALSQARRHREILSILYVGLDRLVAIHQTLGRDAVNRAIDRVGEIIGKRLRSSDVVSRMEDDRILAMLPNATTSDACRIAGELRATVEEQCASLDGLPPLTLSIGVASFPTHSKDVYSLLSAADDAMGLAKLFGRNRVVVAEPPDRA